MGCLPLLPCWAPFHGGALISPGRRGTWGPRRGRGVLASSRRLRFRGVHASNRLWASAGKGERQEADVDLKGASQFRLHLYDHCPYCARVELVLGWRRLSYERVVYRYADVEGPTSLTGKKVLPVLEWSDRQGEQRRMRESVDIIRALDALEGPESGIVLPKTGRKDLKTWQRRLRQVMHELTRPRLIHMPIGDFATHADVQYQMDKYIARGFDYEASLARTSELVPAVEQLLLEFEPLLLGDDSLNEAGWSWDDLYTLPSLRVLTCVAGLTWPARTLHYVKQAHSAAGVGLYFEHAC
uniref:GST N-terminal domain-containing protein n=1 Tax=Pyrodinium bahamense TaxID=73915 RepID=A0A7S0A4D1_9DINO